MGIIELLVRETQGYSDLLACSGSHNKCLRAEFYAAKYNYQGGGEGVGHYWWVSLYQKIKGKKNNVPFPVNTTSRIFANKGCCILCFQDREETLPRPHVEFSVLAITEMVSERSAAKLRAAARVNNSQPGQMDLCSNLVQGSFVGP